jgi:hypothetical protein
MRAKPWCLIAVACVALVAWMPAVADEEQLTAADPTEECAAPSLDYTPVEGVEVEPALLLDVEKEAVAPKPCRKNSCPEQPWCECTYNGQPRISCDPCCYQTYYGVICTS